MSKTNVLDCTLRDGGYYNDWCFSDELVDDYLRSIKHSGVTHIEIGLRTPKTDNFFGPYAFCTEEFLSQLALPSNLQIGVMVNAKDYIEADKANLNLLKENFIAADKSHVSFVRIACHLHEVPAAGDLVKDLKALGYTVGLNLMQAFSKTPEQIKEVATMVQSWNAADVLYFADSMGAMTQNCVSKMIDMIRTGWQGALGIHAHNNKGLALENTLTAANLGASWLDSTITGMGRGAGNCPTEYLLLELFKKDGKSFKPEALFNLVLGRFSNLQNKYQWGPSLLYYLSGEYDIHPTYVQTIIANSDIESHQLIHAMEKLKSSGANSYSKIKFDQALENDAFQAEGTWSPESLVEGRDVLIIGGGPSVATHLPGVEKFINTYKPVVLSLNINPYLKEQIVDAYVACNPMRLITNRGQYEKLGKPLIAPQQCFSKMAGEGSMDVKDYGLIIGEHDYAVQAKQCYLKSPLAFPYAFAVAKAGGAKRVFLVGFDGFDPKDARQQEMDKLNQDFIAKQGCEVLALTPTTFDFQKHSLYAPVK